MRYLKCLRIIVLGTEVHLYHFLEVLKKRNFPHLESLEVFFFEFGYSVAEQDKIIEK